MRTRGEHGARAGGRRRPFGTKDEKKSGAETISPYRRLFIYGA
jgi:hypothetical protein